jgi:O-glycosyl hydrolase
MRIILILLLLPVLETCGKNGSGGRGNNHSPVTTLVANLVKVDPFTYAFTANATDQDLDPLTYTWDFGEGTTKQGAKQETFIYLADKTFTVKVKVTDGKSAPVEATATINTKTFVITADISKKFQVMEGFGGFGAQMEYWGGGPFTSSQFVNTLINDLGLTILRDNISTNFEQVNDNSDPMVTDLAAYNLHNTTQGHDGKADDHFQYLKDMKAAGLQKLIVSIWSPAVWMKYNNKPGNGTTNQNSAPPYTTNPDANTNQLKTDMYQEFAEYCVAYIKTIKQETGIDIYALSIQNEPRFSQFYASCVYNGAAMRDVIKVVGKRLEDEGLATKLFLPEDVGYYDGIKSLVDPVLADADARKYVDMIAVHGYANDGVNPGSTDAVTWQNMYNWGAPYNMPLWMTETSGYANTQDGAIALSKAMYIALKYGNASAWVFWSLSTTTLDAYSLMSSTGAKSRRYYTSKNYYRYIRPGAQRYDVTADDTHILPLAFSNTTEQSNTLVIINDDKTGKPVKLTGAGIPSSFNMYVTTADDNCKDYGTFEASAVILLPANSVVTLYKK